MEEKKYAPGLNPRIKKVEAGESRVYENWCAHAGCTKEAFIEGLKWLYEEPTRRPDGQTLKSIGCTKDGQIVRVKKVYYSDGSFAGFYRIDTGMIWDKSYPLLTTHEQV